MFTDDTEIAKLDEYSMNHSVINSIPQLFYVEYGLKHKKQFDNERHC